MLWQMILDRQQFGFLNFSNENVLRRPLLLLMLLLHFTCNSLLPYSLLLRNLYTCAIPGAGIIPVPYL